MTVEKRLSSIFKHSQTELYLAYIPSYNDSLERLEPLTVAWPLDRHSVGRFLRAPWGLSERLYKDHISLDFHKAFFRIIPRSYWYISFGQLFFFGRPRWRGGRVLNWVARGAGSRYTSVPQESRAVIFKDLSAQIFECLPCLGATVVSIICFYNILHLCHEMGCLFITWADTGTLFAGSRSYGNSETRLAVTWAIKYSSLINRNRQFRDW